MKLIIYIFIITIASTSSFYVGTVYHSNEIANNSKDVISTELQITERNFNIPFCSSIKTATGNVTVDKNGSDYILWSYDDNQNLIKKTIVTSDMNTIYTETPVECDK